MGLFGKGMEEDLRETRKMINRAVDQEDVERLVDICAHDKENIQYVINKVGSSAKAKAFNVIDSHINDFKFLMSVEEKNTFLKIKSTIDKIDFLKQVIINRFKK